MTGPRGRVGLPRRRFSAVAVARPEISSKHHGNLSSRWSPSVTQWAQGSRRRVRGSDRSSSGIRSSTVRSQYFSFCARRSNAVVAEEPSRAGVELGPPPGELSLRQLLGPPEEHRGARQDGQGQGEHDHSGKSRSLHLLGLSATGTLPRGRTAETPRAPSPEDDPAHEARQQPEAGAGP